MSFAHWPHKYYFLIFIYVSWADLPPIDFDISEISVVALWLLIEADQVHVVIGSFQEDRGVVVEEKIEERNVSWVFIVLQGWDGFVSDFEHHIAIESEEYFGRSVFSFLFDLLQHIVHWNVDVVKHSFGLEAQGE